ncbi:hypothetical protein R6V09_20515 [Streptomyces sp. W16]|uniref:hypothetical protein n=1 Tax=Streptomyces sp. W16 TaxID=3076631 RepID=UPI00295B79E1|nr:hypothetical protein [Streptomyces sp. W16]MDV9172477.1 hypothetical protein [Streptomyces sp. W16]
MPSTPRVGRACSPLWIWCGPLDFELLRGRQRHILGTSRPPSFRSLPAFAKGGGERYGIGPDTRELLDACLAESAPGDGRPSR